MGWRETKKAKMMMVAMTAMISRTQTPMSPIHHQNYNDHDNDHGLVLQLTHLLHRTVRFLRVLVEVILWPRQTHRRFTNTTPMVKEWQITGSMTRPRGTHNDNEHIQIVILPAIDLSRVISYNNSNNSHNPFYHHYHNLNLNNITLLHVPVACATKHHGETTKINAISQTVNISVRRSVGLSLVVSLQMAMRTLRSLGWAFDRLVLCS